MKSLQFSYYTNLYLITEMEARCLLIPLLIEGTRNWISKLVVVEKTLVRCGKHGGNPYQRIVFADSENNAIQGIIYAKDLDVLDPLLQLHSTFYIGSARISSIDNNFYLGTSQFQLVLTKSTFIRLVPPQFALTYEQYYRLTPFSHIHKSIDDPTATTNILCAVIQALPQRTIPRGEDHALIQEFIIVNEEKKPIILTMWDEFVRTEAAYLSTILADQPIMFVARAKINSVYNLSASTQATSIIMYDLPIPQTYALKDWVRANRPYIEAIITERLYDPIYQTIHPPTLAQVRSINQMISAPKTAKPFWIKAEIRIINPYQQFYFLSCPNTRCKKGTGAQIDMEFTCFHCHTAFAHPQPRLKFDIQLFDGTGFVNASIDDANAEQILTISPQTIVQMEQMNEQVDITFANNRLQDKQFYIQIRNTARSMQPPRYVILACLPVPDLQTPSLTSTSQDPTSPTSTTSASISASTDNLMTTPPEKQSNLSALNPTTETSTSSLVKDLTASQVQTNIHESQLKRTANLQSQSAPKRPKA